jgi:hypothetical protein
MHECSKCHQWTMSYDFQGECKKCYRIECNYSEWYCPEKWLIETDCLDSLLGKPHIINEKCRKHKDCDSNYKQEFYNECLDCICLPKEINDKLRNKIIVEIL